jgi:hypothetical protein
MGNPFMAFAQQERKKIVAENPSLKSDIGKVGKMMGERWRKLSDAEKAKYKTMSMTSSTRKAGKKSRKNRKEQEQEVAPRKEKKTRKGTRKGTRKLSGYMKFVKAKRSEVISENPKMKSDIMAVGKEMGKRWRALSDSEKAKYT